MTSPRPCSLSDAEDTRHPDTPRLYRPTGTMRWVMLLESLGLVLPSAAALLLGSSLALGGGAVIVGFSIGHVISPIEPLTAKSVGLALFYLLIAACAALGCIALFRFIVVLLRFIRGIPLDPAAERRRLNIALALGAVPLLCTLATSTFLFLSATSNIAPRPSWLALFYLSGLPVLLTLLHLRRFLKTALTRP